MASPRVPGSHSRRGPRSGRGAVVFAAVSLAGAALTACGSSSVGLVLYSGQHEQTTQAVVAAFTKATGITVSVRYDDEDILAETIDNEGRQSPADVIWSENSPALAFLDDKHLLAPLPTPTLIRTPARFDATSGDWVGVSARVSVIVYNPALISVAELPTSVLELADPRYRGKLALSATETDFQPIITSVVHAEGRARALAWLEAIKRNASANLYPDNETVTAQVNAGQAAFGVIDQYYWYRMRAQLGVGAMHSALAYFAPGDPGYVIDVSGAAVLAAAPHASNAQRFVAFLVSHAGEEVIAHSTSFEYPLGSGVGTAQPETPFTALAPSAISLAQLGDGQEAVSLLQQAGFL